MSPILGARGGLSASAYGFTSSVRIPGDYESIATVIVGGGGSSSISFTSIPSTYKHLQIRGIARGSYSAAGLSTTINLNGASNASTGYRHHLYANGSTASGYATGYYGTIGGTPGATISSSIYGSILMDILDYTNTNKTKTLRCLTAFDANGSGEIAFGSAYTPITAAISAIELIIDGSWVSGSTLALYGIKG
jgi:hypothetical protein